MRLSRYYGRLAAFLVAVVSLNSSPQAQLQGPALSGFPGAVERVLPCVVRVMGETTEEKIREYAIESAVSPDKKRYVFGSGFFVSVNGTIVTANHVVAPITGDITVETKYAGNLVRRKAVLVAQDRSSDVAILKIDGQGWPKVDMIDSASLPVGESIGFVGYPRGLSFPVVSKGIVSARVNMSLKEGLDACNWMLLSGFVNPGNSGGPVFLERTGQVIGLVNARKTADTEKRMISLPADYQPVMTLRGIDPISLAVETYNKNLELIGDVSQFGIGFAAPAEYALKLEASLNGPNSRE